MRVAWPPFGKGQMQLSPNALLDLSGNLHCACVTPSPPYPVVRCTEYLGGCYIASWCAVSYELLFIFKVFIWGVLLRREFYWPKGDSCSSYTFYRWIRSSSKANRDLCREFYFTFQAVGGLVGLGYQLAEWLLNILLLSGWPRAGVTVLGNTFLSSALSSPERWGMKAAGLMVRQRVKSTAFCLKNDLWIILRLLLLLV